MLSLILIEYDRNNGFFSLLVNLNLIDDENIKKHIFYMALGLSTLTTIVLILLLMIICFQIKFILSNETTSENIRRPAHLVNVFDNGCKKNMGQFCNNITGYRTEMVYNEHAIKLLSNSDLITKNFLFMRTRGSVTDVSKKTSVKLESGSDISIEMNMSTNSNKTSNNLIVEKIPTK